MRRVLAMLFTASCLVGAGCGSKSYEARLARTLEEMKYQKRLNDNLMPPPKRDQGKYEELLIYIRPPKNMVPSSKEFLLYPAIEPGKFDLEGSFIEDKKQTPSLHVLARIKKPKDTSKKKAAPTAADKANRGEFNTDVLAIVNAVYSTDLDLAKFKDQTEKRNTFKHHTLDVGDKNVQIYLYGRKDDTHQVALIFEYPKAEQQALVSKIKLCLESFAVGRRAQAAYSGMGGEEGEGGGAGGAGAGTGVAF